MIIRIEDDFDLEKIVVSGQCFRARKMNTGTYRFITGRHILYIRESGDSEFECSCSEEEWSEVWHPYFDLDRDYRAVREKILCENEFINHAVEMGQGIRVLRQDPWETLVTFIISQRKSIPSIAACVEKIAKTAGKPVLADTSAAEYGSVEEIGTEDGEPVFGFPNPEEILASGEERIAACGLGYRLPYVMSAAEKALTIDFKALDLLDDEALFDAFTAFYGVGKKISNCVCLFAYGRVSRVPVDTWIDKVIREDCGGCDPFPGFGEVAGIIQQYVFYCARLEKSPGRGVSRGTEQTGTLQMT